MNKNIFRKILLYTFLTGVFGLFSCTEYLDKAPETEISPGEAFKSFRNFQGFTEELYNCVPLFSAQSWHNNWNFGDDEYWEPGETRMLAYNIESGDYWAWNTSQWTPFRNGGNINVNDVKGKAGLWKLCWYGIRKANTGIANLDKLTDATNEEKDLIAGQLHFFRGWFHFMIMQYWGGLPYIDFEIPSDAVFRYPRLSYQETAEKVSDDFQKAAGLLPVDWDNTEVGQTTLGDNNFRINKIMALAFDGKNLLWAGSPLMNEESTGDDSYNEDYCKRAADVFAEALSITESTNRYSLASFDNYSQLFYTYNQNGKLPGLREAIFVENLQQSDSRFRWNQVNDYRPMVINASGIKVYPTANYVDWYGMANGMPLSDSQSGYDPEYPWKNRDPRFYHDIIFDGVKCALNSEGNLEEDVQYASLYSGGKYRTANGTKAVLTGYMNSKFTSKLLNDWDGYKNGNTMVLSLLRLADVYLMYAEAAAVGYGSPNGKASGYGLSAVEAVNIVRERAGVDPVHSKYLGDTETFLKELQRERAVELAFEGHRFVDLRRWKLLLQRPYTLKTGVEFDRAKEIPNEQLYENPVEGKVLNLRQTIIHERNFGVKHYWFPFLKDDVNLYEEFNQNPGW
jgi:hypothetical protein